jgi:CheY-like chemotaxis protein
MSAAFAARCGWDEGSPPDGVYPQDIAYELQKALDGGSSYHWQRSLGGKTLRMWFNVFLNPATVIELQLALIVGKRNQLHLAIQQELDLPAQPRARILLAEDDSALACTTCVLLERAGFVATHAADGIDAWQMANTQAFDIALLDVDMPGLTGDEVCRRIKASPALSHLSVVLFSGHADLETLAAKAGADAFLEKPANLMRLTACLKHLLRL